MRIRIDDSAYSSKFHPIIHSWDRYIISWGGRGSSKTDSFYLKYLISLFEPYYFKLAYVNKEGSNIRDQQYAGFKRVAKRIGVYDKLKFYDGDYRIVNVENGNMLIPKGMDDPEKTKGMDDITAIWWDEINKGTIEDFRALNELLRSPQAMYLQFAISFNPVHKEHWLRHTFFHPDDSHVLHPDWEKQTLMLHSTYRDNEYIDQEAYLQTLLLSAAGNLNSIRVNVDGDWGLEENNDPWLYAFDANKHVKPKLPFIFSAPVYLSFDFNKHPVTCTATQMSPSKGMSDSFLHVIKEFHGDVSLGELCKRIQTTFPQSIFFVTGDASGASGHLALEEVGKNETFYTLIKRHLGLTDKQIHTFGKNLAFNDSRMLCNHMLHHYPNFYISQEGCPMLINDMHVAQVDEKGTDANKLKKDRDIFRMDMLDNWRYMLQRYYFEYFNKVLPK